MDKQENYSLGKAIKKKVDIPPIMYPYSGQEHLVIKRNIPYCAVNNEEQTFDIYYPTDFKRFSAPTVLFVNGGGPIRQNIKNYPCFTSWGELAALNGIISIVFNWRSGKYSDVDAMLGFMMEHAEALGIDTNNICVFPLCRGVSGTIKCVLKYPAIRRVVTYYGKINKSISVRSRSDMAFLIVMAEKDSIYDSSCNDWLIADAIKAGNHASKIVHPTGVHGFDYINDCQETRDIIDDTLSFIKTERQFHG